MYLVGPLFIARVSTYPEFLMNHMILNKSLEKGSKVVPFSPLNFRSNQKPSGGTSEGF
jgi:hypothetical protein